MTNPFATHFVAPGKVDWIGVGHHSLETIQERFEQLRCRAQILGVHGSGKSTLLEHLVPRLGAIRYRQDADGAEMCGEGKVVWLQLRKHPQRVIRHSRRYWSQGGLLVVDGWEQLSFPGRCKVLWRSQRCGMNLLVTAHQDRVPKWASGWCTLPVLYEAEVTPQLAASCLTRIAPEIASHFDHARLSQTLSEHGGNFREVLMEMFDDFQLAQRQNLQKPTVRSQ